MKHPSLSDGLHVLAGLERPLFLQVLLTLFALAIRLATIPFWRNLSLQGDEVYYWNLALDLSRGVGIPKDIVLHPPLWGLMLSGVAAFTKDPFYGRLLAALLGAATTVFIFRLGWKIFSLRVAVIASILYSLYPNYLGFSHYLWSETVYTLLSAVASCLFIEVFQGEVRLRMLCLLSSFTGLALLAKESAVLLFAAIMLTALGIQFKKKALWLTCAALLFLIPACSYSVYGSYRNDRLIALADAPFYNANQVLHGRNPWSMGAAENQRMFMQELIQKAVQLPRTYPEQLSKLWTPNSFVIWRLFKGDYKGISCGRLLVGVIAGTYIIIIVLGLTGLLVSDSSLFRIFTFWNIVLLNLSPTVFLMCSRFRMPFMYFMILYASAFLADPGALRRCKIFWAEGLAWGLAVAAFVAIVIVKWESLGQWG